MKREEREEKGGMEGKEGKARQEEKGEKDWKKKGEVKDRPRLIDIARFCLSPFLAIPSMA